MRETINYVDRGSSQFEGIRKTVTGFSTMTGDSDRPFEYVVFTLNEMLSGSRGNSMIWYLNIYLL